MTNQERIKALYDRIDGILERSPDNPIYEEKDARSVLNYAQAVRIVEDLLEREGRKQ